MVEMEIDPDFGPSRSCSGIERETMDLLDNSTGVLGVQFDSATVSLS